MRRLLLPSAVDGRLGRRMHTMASKDVAARVLNWRMELPTLCGSLVTLREPVNADTEPLLELLSLPDAARFDLSEAVETASVRRMIERALRDRASGIAFTYAIVLADHRSLVGLIQVRQLDPFFEGALWDCTVAPRARGTGVFGEAAHLVGSFAFASTGVRRLESRVDVNNVRAMFALRKIGAVQEGVLRRAVRRGDDYVDQTLWAVLKETWDTAAPSRSVVIH